MKLKALSAALLAAGSVSAFAVGPGSLGTIDNTSVVVGNNVSGAFFFDTYTFTITGTSTISGGAFPAFISGFTAVLQDSTFASIGTDTTPSDGFSFSGLAAGNYAISFLGFPTSSTLSAYGGVVTAVTTVPEPETYALMLAGLGVMGFVATRRRSSRGG